MKRLGIIGIGQIGGSMALSARGHGYCDVTGFDVDEETCRRFKEDGFSVYASIRDLVNECDLIAICVPMHAYRAVLEQIYIACQRVSSEKIVFDVGSASSALHRESAKYDWPKLVVVIGSHPMAGTENFGYQSASKSLFENKTWAVISDGNIRPSSIICISQFFILLGAKVVLIARRAHDETVAYVSHLPNILAFSLSNIVLKSDDFELRSSLSAGSFSDATRVALSDPTLILSMCLENQSGIDGAITKLINSLSDIRNSVRRQCKDDLEKFFTDTRQSKLAWKALRDASYVSRVSYELLLSDDLIEDLLRKCKAGCKILNVEVDADSKMINVDVEIPEVRK